MGPKPPVASPSESPLRALLEGTVLPSPNTVEMMRTAPSDYRRRFDGGNPHVAELFQENTKLSPHTTLHDRGDAAALDHARAWYLSTAYRVEDDDLAAGQADTVRPPVDTLPPSLAGILAPFAQAGRLSSLLYTKGLGDSRRSPSSRKPAGSRRCSTAWICSSSTSSGCCGSCRAQDSCGATDGSPATTNRAFASR